MIIFNQPTILYINFIHQVKILLKTKQNPSHPCQTPNNNPNSQRPSCSKTPPSAKPSVTWNPIKSWISGTVFHSWIAPSIRKDLKVLSPTWLGYNLYVCSRGWRLTGSWSRSTQGLRNFHGMGDMLRDLQYWRRLYLWGINLEPNRKEKSWMLTSMVCIEDW